MRTEASMASLTRLNPSPTNSFPGEPLQAAPPNPSADAVRMGALRDLAMLGDFQTIANSPLWRLSEMFWAQTGSEAFASGEVPYVVTNDGPHAGDAADLFVESALAAEKAGALEEELIVLELGVGSGLFAKLFLDQLLDRCRREGLDYYDRTRYVATDGSTSMLDDLENTGVLADHAERVLCVRLRVPEIETAVEAARERGLLLSGGVRAVHANYLFDSLPFTLLCLDRDEAWELHVRGRMPEEDLERLHLDTGDDALDLDLVGSDPQQLEAIQESLILETRYVPVERSEIPLACALPNVDPNAGPIQFLHSYAALECLESVASLLRPDGHFVITDYGYTSDGERPVVFETQNFGRTVASGVNFEQISNYATARLNLNYYAPAQDPENLQSRLIGRRVAPQVTELFQQRYSGEKWEQRNTLLVEARKLADEGRFEAARWKFEQLLRQQPFSWSAHEVTAAYLAYSLEEADAAIVVARRGLELNHLNSGLWNVLGDSHFLKKEFDIAEQCYEHALTVNPSDPRGRMNLAYLAVMQRQFAKALRLIGEAMALDREGEFHEVLLEKQREALSGLVQSAARGVLRGANRMRGHYHLPHATVAAPRETAHLTQEMTHDNGSGQGN